MNLHQDGDILTFDFDIKNRIIKPYASLLILIVPFCLFLGWTAVRLFEQAWLFYVAVMILSGFLLYFLYLESKVAEPTLHCVFDTSGRMASFEVRPPWLFFSPRNRNHPLDDLEVISVVQDDKGTLRVYLRFGQRKSYRLVGIADIQEVQTISAFLEIPMTFYLGGRQVTQRPWLTDRLAKPEATFCMRCGAPLPRIQPDTANVTCSHCGMTMIVRWEDGSPTFRMEKP